MKLGRQQKLVLALVTGVFVAAGALAVIGRREFEERWLIWKFQSVNPLERIDAARRLGELKSARAVPILLDRLAEEEADGSFGTGGGCVAEPPTFSPATTYHHALLAIGPGAVPHLVAQLAQGPGAQRRWAVELLGIILPPFEEDREPDPVQVSIIAALKSVLGDEDAWVQGEAAMALRSTGPAGVQALLQVLARGGQRERACVARALGYEDYWQAPGVLPALIKATRDPAREVQLESALAVLSISMGDESTSLEDESTAEVHRTAIESVRDDLLAVLIAAVDAQDMERVNLHRVLGERGSWPDTWLPFLEKFIRSEDPAVCGLAAAVLTYPPPDSALQLLLDCRQAENTYVRHAAVIGLSHLALNHSEALAGLVRSLEDVSDDVRSATVSELSSLGSLAIVPQILAALGSENERVRSGAAQAIRKGFEDLDDIDVFGRDRPAPRTVALAVAARAILEALKPLLTDPSPAVREEVAWALGYVAKWTFHRGKEVLDLLSDHDPRVRAGAATAVSICGGGRQGLASRLLAALEGLTGGERAACLRALGAAYREAEIVLPQLLKALESGGDEERQAASWALHRLGTRALPADPHLRRLVQDRSLPPDVRRVAWYAFEKIHRDDHERLFPELATATSDPQGEILSDAFKFLERLGEKARPAIPSLLDVLRSGRREEVGRALKLLDRLSECTPAVVRLIVERARTADPSLLGVLSSVARGNEAAFQGLQEALADRSLRREAVLALATTGNAGRSVLPELRRLAREDDRELQDAIAPTVLAIEQARDGE